MEMDKPQPSQPSEGEEAPKTPPFSSQSWAALINKQMGDEHDGWATDCMA